MPEAEECRRSAPSGAYIQSPFPGTQQHDVEINLVRAENPNDRWEYPIDRSCPQFRLDLTGLPS